MTDLIIRTAALAGLALYPFAPLQAQAQTSMDVLAAPVARGTLLGPADFVAEDATRTASRDILTAEQASGLEATRNLRAGYPVRRSDVREPRLVRRGEPVSIVLRNGPLTIRTAGRSLDDGSEGERVRVVADATHQTLDATVESTGRVFLLVH